MPTIDHKKILLAALATSLGLHVFLFVVSPRSLPKVERRPTRPVAVRLTERAPTRREDEALPSPVHKPAAKRKQRQTPKSRGSSSPRRDGTAKAQTPSQTGESKASYADLLGIGEPRAVSAGEVGERTPYLGTHHGELLAAASDVRAEFDLPLAFRRVLTEGRAYARLRLDSSGIAIAMLGGTPEIRAALFATLTAETALSHIRRAFTFFEANEYKITVDYTTHPGEPRPAEFETEQKIFASEIQFVLKRFPDAPKYGVTGIAIEDEHSRKAKRRDRQKWQALRELPAYKHHITNYSLCHIPNCG